MSRGLHVEEITEQNLDAALGIQVREDQAHLVAPVVKSLAEAYVHRDQAWPRLILDGDRPVGFLMGFFDIDFDPIGIRPEPRSGLWRLNVAAGSRAGASAASRSRPSPRRSGGGVATG